MKRASLLTSLSQCCGIACFVFLPPLSMSVSAELDSKALEQTYHSDIWPLLRRYCHECHGADFAEGEINLAALEKWEDVSKHAETWETVGEMLSGDLMPPDDARQPNEAERKKLLAWVQNFLAAESQIKAGDPGRVVFRRLSNAEYTYTLRDLTCIEALDPAREFPVDGAAGEGFTNNGSALVMSPALVTKYLDAAKEVAGHAVLLPDGIRFSRHTTDRDRTEEILAQIRQFYSEFSDPRGGDTVNLQGVVFETNDGGRLPIERYLAVLLVERTALTAGEKSIEAVASQYGLSAKYLGALWTSLNGTDSSLLMDPLRARWRTAVPDDAVSLASDILAWQKGLWTFSSVGHIGKVGGPKKWLQPLNPLVEQQELRFKIPASKDGKHITVWLVATDAGDGNDHDFVIWQHPRLVAPNRPDVPLRDLRETASNMPTSSSENRRFGLDPKIFGEHPNGQALDPASICVRAPSVLEVHLPAELTENCELVTTAVLDTESGAEGSVQLQIAASEPSSDLALRPSEATVTLANKQWSDDNRIISHSAPILVSEGSATKRRLETAFEEFRQLFPPALCYAKIVPVDEVVTLTLFYREDDHLAQLMLDESQQQKLDRLWDELRYISRDALTSVDVLEQLMEFATQDADPKVFEPLKQPIKERAIAFQQQLVDSEPTHIDAMLEFASGAYRRPLTAAEKGGLRSLYDDLRRQELPHDEAFRLTLARVLIAPNFLYHIEMPSPGTAPTPISDWELASRLSYFLWSTMPDDELLQIAATGDLRDPQMLIAQTRRMLRDAKIRRLANEFACQWLHIREFEHLNEKSERHFPTFADLRVAMYEESVQFFTDLFQNDGSVLDILDADHTFLNATLARHYNIPGVEGPKWRRVNGVKQYGRGGILAQATTLATQSGASRTSPILRGNWISEVLLGERLPNPPPGVPPLPDNEGENDGLTVRQLVEKHVSEPACAVCHKRIDPYGFSLEAYDAIGRYRETDVGKQPIDARATTPDGVELEGIHGLRKYLVDTRRDAFVRQFCRKLLGYALARSVQPSDERLLDDMSGKLQSEGFRVSAAIEAIVTSSQFREIRGRDSSFQD